MTSGKLDSLGDEDLVDLFETWAATRGKAIIDGEIPEANHAYKNLKAVHDQLCIRGIAARSRILRLLDHEDVTVRFHAAKWLYALSPERARSILKDVEAQGPRALAGAAGMTLLHIDTGVFKPT
jgi:hypothetical protein